MRMIFAEASFLVMKMSQRLECENHVSDTFGAIVSLIYFGNVLHKTLTSNCAEVIRSRIEVRKIIVSTVLVTARHK